MKKITLVVCGILFFLGLGLASNQEVYGQQELSQTDRVCCIDAPMRYCVVVIYTGPNGPGTGEHFPFGGIKVACPRIP